MPIATPSPSTAASCARRTAATPATRSTTRATRSSTPSPPLPTRWQPSPRRWPVWQTARSAIRVGIHTGTPAPDPPKYVGMDVHFAARVMSSAHGGQVVCSEATAAAVDLELTELGEHRLKDIAEAVALYQLGEGSFPPLKTISNTNLPRPASSFLGRQAELERGARADRGRRPPPHAHRARRHRQDPPRARGSLLARAGVQGRRLLGRARHAPRSRARDRDDRPDARRQGRSRRAHRRAGDAAPARQPRAGDRGSARALRLLARCPNLTLLVTSRELLRVSGEVEYAVPRSPSQKPSHSSASARSSSPPTRSPSYARGSTRSRSPSSSPPPARRRSLPRRSSSGSHSGSTYSRAAAMQTHGSRRSEPRSSGATTCFRPRSSGSSPASRSSPAAARSRPPKRSPTPTSTRCSRSSRRASCASPNGRYWMLETIREYAGQRLGDADRVEIRRRHAEWFTRLAEAGAPGSREPAHAEVDNIRTALMWSIEVGDGVLELRLAYATRRYWANSGQVPRRVLAWLLGAAERGPPELAEQRAMVLTTAAFCALRQGDVEQARPNRRVSAGDLDAIGRQRLRSRARCARHSCRAAGAFDRSRSLFERAVEIARAQGQSSVLASALFNLGDLEYMSGNFPRSIELSSEALDVFAHAGDAQGEAHARIAIGRTCLHLNCVDEGVAFSCEGLRRVHALAIPGLTVVALLSLAEAARLMGDHTRATQLLGAAEGTLEEIGESLETSDSLSSTA